MSRRFLTALVISILIFAMSCAVGRSGIPTGPSTSNDETEIQIQTDEASGHYLWAYYLIHYDPEEGGFDLIPLRQAEDHWNVLKFLEGGPCTSCVKILGSVVGTNPIAVTIQIDHPFPTANLTGFDVRGIAMFPSGTSFPSSGLSIPDRNAGTGELTDAQGYTALYNSSTTGSGPAGLQGYYVGNFASSTSPNASVNGYKRLISANPANTRNAFYAGDSIVETYQIWVPSGPFTFGYAIDASWCPPTTKPVTDPMIDFPPEANSLEAWKIDITQTPVGTGLTDLGGKQELTIDVYDWQGMASHHAPVVECPDLFSGTQTATFQADWGSYSQWTVQVENVIPAPAGTYKCLVSVEDIENSIMPSWIDLRAYQVVDLTVNSSSSVTSGWVQAYGGSVEDIGYDVVVDTNGNSYIMGGFGGTVDFDPGTGVDNHTSISGVLLDASVSKFDSSGNFQWARTWGGLFMDAAASGVVDSLGNVYITGFWVHTVDFDPTAGTDIRTALGQYDCYLMKLTPNGDYLWTQTWGGTLSDACFNIAIGTSDNLYLCGKFEGTVDFDPGIGTVNKTSAGDSDGFILCLNSSGSYLWVDTWGGAGFDACSDVHVTATGLLFAAGAFDGTSDLDPSAGTFNVTSNGGRDAFVSQFDTSGNWNWSQAWGGTGDVYPRCITASSVGIIYIGGSYESTVDFDPGPGTVSYTSNGLEDAFLTTFNTMGAHAGAVVWGSTGGDEDIQDMALRESPGYLYAIGSFGGSCDFNPGTGTSNCTPAGMNDLYISRFDLSMTHQTVIPLGGSSQELGMGIDYHDSTGNIYATGAFGATVNFNTTGGTENRTSVGATDLFILRLDEDGMW